MKFFLPQGSPQDNAETWRNLTAAGQRAVYSVTYEQHERSKFVVTVGKERQEYPRETGPRGGYIRNAGRRRWASSTGTTVILIVESAGLVEVYSLPPYGGWSNPSRIGLNEVTSVEYFDPPDDEPQ